MKPVSLPPIDISLPTSFTAQLVAAIGQKDFAACVLQAFDTHIAASHCTVFALNDAGRVMAVATASSSGEAATITAIDYMRMGFDKKDSNMVWLAAQRPLRRRRIWLSHQSAEEVADLEYRQVCYGANGIRDRLSVLYMQPDGQRIAVSFYRSFSRDAFGAHDCSVLAGCAEFLLSVVQAHARQASGSAAREETRQLILSGLTHRERQVITSILSGKTMKEAAADLGISVTTVLTYRYRSFAKLNIRTQRDLLAVLGGAGQTAARR